jgi:thiamine biosynthesis protein ThiS
LKIVLNGSPKEVADEIAIEELIGALELSSAQVAVEVHGALVVRSERASFQLAESDVVELVTLVGGG